MLFLYYCHEKDKYAFNVYEKDKYAFNVFHIFEKKILVLLCSIMIKGGMN